jgi:iron(III) transport system permease protein
MNELSLYHILYLNIIASLVNIDPVMEEAAANLGCTGIKRFLKLLFPHDTQCFCRFHTRFYLVIH